MREPDEPNRKYKRKPAGEAGEQAVQTKSLEKELLGIFVSPARDRYLYYVYVGSYI